MLAKISAPLLLICTLCQTGCFGLSFGGTQGEVHHTHTHHYSAPTLAQELSELKQVKNERILTDSEYSLVKSRLLNEYNSTEQAKEMTAGHVSNIELTSHEQSTDTSGLKMNFISPQPVVGIPVESPSPFKQKMFKQATAEELKPLEQ